MNKKYDDFINLDFKIESFVNTYPVVVKFKDCTKTLIFKNKPEKIETKESKKDIFANEVLFKPTVKEIEKNKYEINMCLYANSRLTKFIQFLGSVLQISIIDLDIPKSEILNFDEEFPISTYSQYLCVGKNPLIFESKSNMLPNYSDYSEDYLKWYNSINNYICDIVERAEGKTKSESKTKDKDKKETKKDETKTKKDDKDNNFLQSISFTHNISNIEMVCYCIKPVYVDLIELFNYHNSLYKFKRIVIHDVKLDEYYNSVKIQYIKNSRNYGVSTKHVEGKQNTLTINYLLSISEEICLDTIDVFHDGTFKLNFNISCNLSEKQMMETISDYVNNNISTLFEDLLIKYVAYPENEKDLELSISDYKICSSKFKSVYLISDIDPKNIKKINTILTLQDTESRFSSNTSLSLIAHPFINEHIIYNLYNSYKSYKVINENMTKINIIPEIHFTFSGSNLTIFCNKFYSIAELKFELSYLLPLIDYANISKESDDNLNPTEAILKRLRNIPVKQNLKQLVSIDPELFGPRKVSKKFRAYSALCQIKEQRPSIITDREYEILKESMPESVIKLTNQTFTNQDLNIACPYEKFPILNFHHFNNQKCIVRCTTKQTNPGQYNNCASELGADIITESKMNHRSNNIIKYNNNLPLNRYCYLPPELQEVFSDYLCINFASIKSNTDIKDFVKSVYKCMCLIIRRNIERRDYEIISDFDVSQTMMKYVLVIEPESNPHLKYLVINSGTFQPLFIDDYKNFKEFIKHVYKSSKINEENMNYLNKILNLKLETDVSMYQFINKICSKDYRLIIKDECILGLINNETEKIYLTPRINYPYKQQGQYFTNDYVIKNIRNKNIEELYPDIMDVKKHVSEGDKYCYDPVMNKITGIFWKYTGNENLENILMLVKPIELEKLGDIPQKQIAIYDTTYYIEFLLNENVPDNIKTKNKLNEINIYKKIFIMMIKRFINFNSYSKVKDIKKEFIEFLKKFGMLVKGDNELVKKTSLMYNIFLTKINENKFINYINEYKIMSGKDETEIKMNIDNIIYNNIIENLKLNCDEEEIIIPKQFI